MRRLCCRSPASYSNDESTVIQLDNIIIMRSSSRSSPDICPKKPQPSISILNIDANIEEVV